MLFDLQVLAPRDRYKLLVSVVVPRPIALVTTLDEEGRVNAAPFSFFNVLGSDPPIVALGPGDRSGAGQPKDTARNIRERGEFVVNIVDEALAPAMNICAVDFPPGVDELVAAGLSPMPSVAVKPPRIAQSPVSLECREHLTISIGRNRIVLGEVLRLHIRDDLVDVEKMHVATERLLPIARMHGGSWYARSGDLFSMPRLSFEEWQAAHPDQAEP
jgi:flavin reductase (DIM6/NTAB) family NADH-FMN oxidoreductase RutF